MIAADAVVLSIPYPPSTNTYWRHVGGRTLLSAKGRRYREAVAVALRDMRRPPFDGRLAVRITVHPPDRRRRDLDNVLKATLDALAHAGVYADDSQIDRLFVVRGRVVDGGGLVVEVASVAAVA